MISREPCRCFIHFRKRRLPVNCRGKNQSVILSTKHDTGDAYQPTAGPWDFWVGANSAVVAGRGNVFDPMEARVQLKSRLNEVDEDIKASKRHREHAPES